MRVQLALNVENLEEAIVFYTNLFGVEVNKRKPGYANFAIEKPPLQSRPRAGNAPRCVSGARAGGIEGPACRSHRECSRYPVRDAVLSSEGAEERSPDSVRAAGQIEDLQPRFRSHEPSAQLSVSQLLPRRGWFGLC